MNNHPYDEALWNQLSDKLDSHYGAAQKRRAAWWWFYGVAGVLLLIGAGVWIGSAISPNEIKEQGNLVKTSENGSSEGTTSKSKIPKNAIASMDAEKSSIGLETSETSKEFTNNSKVTEAKASGGIDKVQDVSNTESLPKTIKSDFNTAKKVMKNTTAKIESSKVSTEENDETATNKTISNTAISLWNDGTGNKIEITDPNPPKLVILEDEMPFSPQIVSLENQILNGKTLLAKSLQWAGDELVKKMAATKTRSLVHLRPEPKFSFGIGMEHERSLSLSNSLTGPSNYITYRESSESLKSYTGTNLLVFGEYKNWTISTGIGLGKYTQGVDYKGTEEIKSINNINTYTTIINPNFILKGRSYILFGEVSDTSFNTTSKEKTVHTGTNEYNYITIPLRLSYKIPMNKWFAQLGLGADVQVLQNFKGQIIQEDLESLNGAKRSIRSINNRFSAQAGLGRSLGKFNVELGLRGGTQVSALNTTWDGSFNDISTYLVAQYTF